MCLILYNRESNRSCTMSGTLPQNTLLNDFAMVQASEGVDETTMVLLQNLNLRGRSSFLGFLAACASILCFWPSGFPPHYLLSPEPSSLMLHVRNWWERKLTRGPRSLGPQDCWVLHGRSYILLIPSKCYSCLPLSSADFSVERNELSSAH